MRGAESKPRRSTTLLAKTVALKRSLHIITDRGVTDPGIPDCLAIVDIYPGTAIRGEIPSLYSVLATAMVGDQHQ